MKPAVQVAHQTPGRVRLQMVEPRRDRAAFERLCRQLSDTGLATVTRANPLTGSIVLQFAGEPDALLARLAGALQIELRQRPAPVAARPAGRTRAAPFRLVSGRELNPMQMAGVLFGAVGVAQTLRGKVMLPALSAFWHAANAFRLGGKSEHGGSAD